MADAVTTVIMADGPRNAIVKLTNISDGSGETAVNKVNLADFTGGTPLSLSIERIWVMTAGMGVDILWDATADVLALHVPDLQCAELDFRDIGGLKNTSGAGKTGSIAFTTVGAAAGDRYTIILDLKKD